jgi:DNA polymerase (family 10)
VRVLREHPAADLVSEAGSVRRRKETFRDLDIIATAQDPRAAHGLLRRARLGRRGRGARRHEGDRRLARRASASTFASSRPSRSATCSSTSRGSKDHNLALRGARREARALGLGVRREDGRDRRGVHDARRGGALRVPRLPVHPAELRENLGELDAARKGELPELVDVSQVRGDLHLHSTWSSDGKNTIEEMARKCIERGYQYMVITDHSHYLREARLEAQWREIDQVNERVAPFRILRGIEANIRSNGEVDVAEETLAELDWVVASLHQAFDKSPTERIISAMEHPHVHCIGHPTARKINKRGPADVDIERVIEKALETKTFLEINSQPDRLDLRDVNARRAGEAGLKLPVNTDAHQVSALDWMDIGIAQARRAWLTKDHVLNTRTWKQLEKLKKR